MNFLARLLLWEEGPINYILDPRGFIIQYEINGNNIRYEHHSSPEYMEEANTKTFSNLESVLKIDLYHKKKNDKLEEVIKGLRKNYEGLPENSSEKRRLNHLVSNIVKIGEGIKYEI